MPGTGDLGDELVRRSELLGGHVELILRKGGQTADLVANGAHMRHRVGDVAGAGLSLGADHGRALGDAAQRLSQVGGFRRRRGP